MWTQSSRDADLIRETVPDSGARRLLYQARVNLALYTHARERLHESMDALNAADFARVASCHMTEGVFGADKHAANQMELKEQVIGFLLSVVTAGHRFTRSIQGARLRDASADWKQLKYDITALERKFHDVRNFMEHLDESIARGDLANGTDCTFTPTAILTCTDKDGKNTFFFSRPSLDACQTVYDSVIELLKKRKTPNNSLNAPV
jgi:hypothetical protein